MRFIMLSLLGLSVFYSHVASEPRPAKGGRASHINQAAKEFGTAEDSDEHLLAELLQATDDGEVNNADFSNSRNIVAKASDSNARFFLRRFMRLKNLFGNKNKPIIIQVFLNGTSVVPNIPFTPTGPTPPTIPEITTGPTRPTNPFIPTRGLNVPVDPSMPAVPINTASGPNTPGDRNDNIEYTDDDKSSLELPARVNYQSKVAKKNQSIKVRIPAKYRHLFNNGQQVKLSTKNNTKRKRVPNNRGHVLNSNKSLKNKNRLTRIFGVGN